MTTTKPKIQGYISQWLAEEFEAERERWDLTQSQALERILFERYGSPGSEKVKSTNLLVPDDNRLYRLEEQVRQLLERVAALEITSNLDGDIQEITSDLDSDTLDEEITSNLDGDIQEITSDLDSDTLDEEITSNLDGDTLDEEITSDLDSDTLDEEITSNLDGDAEDYQWMTFEDAWATLPTPKPKDWDDGEQGMLKTRAKRQLREARTGSDHWAKFAAKLFRTIGFELDISRGEQCLRKLPEPIPHVWNLYEPDSTLAAGGFASKRDAQNYCHDYEDKERMRRWRWEYEPSQLSLVG